MLAKRCTLLLLGLFLSGSAKAADSAAQATAKMIELNEQALRDWQELKPEPAREKLLSAIEIGSRAALKQHKMMARTYLHLAAIVVTGLHDRVQGELYLRRAIDIRPDIRLTPNVSTPELEALLTELKANKAPNTAAAAAAAVPGSTSKAGTVAEAALDELLRAAPKETANADPLVSPAADEASVETAPAAPVARKHAKREVRTEDSPLVAVAQAQDREREAALLHRRVAGAFFFGLSAGSGYGWHPSSALELRRELVIDQGMNSAGDFQALPEVGYQLSDSVALSIQMRLQLIRARGAGDLYPGTPAEGALAILGRVQKWIGQGNTQLLVSGSAGVGDAFRLVVPPRGGDTLPRHDTVVAGPIALGPGIGVIHHLMPALALVAEARTLVGLPTVGVVVDLNGGLQVGF